MNLHVHNDCIIQLELLYAESCSMEKVSLGHPTALPQWHALMLCREHH